MNLADLADWIEEIEEDRAFPHEESELPEFPCHLSVDTELPLTPSELMQRRKSRHRRQKRRNKQLQRDLLEQRLRSERNKARIARSNAIVGRAPGGFPLLATHPAIKPELPVLVPPAPSTAFKSTKLIVPVIAPTVPPTVLVPPMCLLRPTSLEMRELAETVLKKHLERKSAKPKADPILDWEKIQLAF